MKKSPYICVVLSIFIQMLFTNGCSNQDRVQEMFEAALRGDNFTFIPGVTGYELTSFEIVQRVGDMVSVRVTFAGKLGNDVVQTKKFRIGKKGELLATDSTDIRKGIEENLYSISILSREFSNHMVEGEKITVDEARKKDSQITTEVLHSIAGESYEAATIEKAAFLPKVTLRFGGELFSSDKRVAQ